MSCQILIRFSPIILHSVSAIVISMGLVKPKFIATQDREMKSYQWHNLFTQVIDFVCVIARLFEEPNQTIKQRNNSSKQVQSRRLAQVDTGYREN